MRILSAFLIGLVFGLGIMLSGMANPAKVLNFFDIFGHWDPSLMFVMGGGVVVTFIGYRFVLARPKPVFETGFSLPGKSALDAKLLIGSGIFGIGWGIGGFCPGGVLPAIGTGRLDVLTFVGALLAGIILTRVVQSLMTPSAAPTTR